MESATQGTHDGHTGHVIGKAHHVLPTCQVALGQLKHLHVQQLREVVFFGAGQGRAQERKCVIEVDVLAAKLAAGPTRAFGGVKKLMSAAMADSLVSQMERESRQIAELSRTPDGLEGVRAFVAKRRPDFMG